MIKGTRSASAASPQASGWAVTVAAHRLQIVAAPARDLGREEGRQLRAEQVPPRQRHHRGQEGDGREHGGEHGDRAGVAERRHQRDAGHPQRQEGDDHGAAGEHDGAARGRHRPGDRLVPLDPAGHLVAVLGHQEQRVVDAHAQADHRRQRRPDRWDVQEMAEQADEAERGGQAEHRGDDGHAHRHQAPEGERQDQHGGEQADDLAALGRRLGQDAAEVAPDADVDARLPGGGGGVEDGVGELLGDVAVGDVQQHRRERGRCVLAHQARGGVGERVRRRGDVRCLGQRLVRGLDRLLVGRVGDLALGDVEDDWAAAVLLRWEAGGEQVRGLLALGAGQAQVVARLGADAPDHQLDDDDEAEPDRDDHDRAVDAQTTKPVQDTGHADNLSPDPDQTTRSRSRHQGKRYMVSPWPSIGTPPD